MKYNKLVNALILGVFLTSTTLTAFATEPDDIVLSFFAASKKGDVEAMRSFIAGPYFDRLETLLTSNADYPRFLRKMNEDVTLYILSTERIGDGVLVTASRESSSGEYGDTKLVLEQNEFGEWKIVDEIIETGYL